MLDTKCKNTTFPNCLLRDKEEVFWGQISEPYSSILGGYNRNIRFDFFEAKKTYLCLFFNTSITSISDEIIISKVSNLWRLAAKMTILKRWPYIISGSLDLF